MRPLQKISLDIKDKITKPLIISALVFGLWILTYIYFRKPYWFLPTDVEMDFLFRALALARGYFYDHAFGIPIDFLGAIIIKLSGIGLKNIALFPKITHIIGLIVSVAGFLILTRTYLRSLPIILAVSAVLFFFANPSARLYWNFWSAEMFVFFIGVIAIIAFEKSLHNKNFLDKKSFLISGLASGFAAAIKPYFLIFIFASCAGLFFRWFYEYKHDKTLRIKNFLKSILYYGVGILISAFVGFIPFINSPKLIFGSLVSRSISNSPIEIFIFNFNVLIHSAPVWFIFTIIVALMLGFILIKLRLNNGLKGQTPAFIFTITICILLGILSALVQQNAGTLNQLPGIAIRFFLPTALYGMFGLAIIFNFYKQNITRKQQLLILLLALSIISVQFLKDTRSYNELTKKTETIEYIVNEQIINFIVKYNRAPRVLYGDISKPSAALHIGDQYSRGLFKKEIETIFPEEGYKNLSYPLTDQDIAGYDIAIFLNVPPDYNFTAAIETEYSIDQIENLTFLRKLENG